MRIIALETLRSHWSLPFRTVYVRFIGSHAEYDRIDVESV